jgi:hypothetical protein
VRIVVAYLVSQIAGKRLTRSTAAANASSANGEQVVHPSREHIHKEIADRLRISSKAVDTNKANPESFHDRFHERY